MDDLVTRLRQHDVGENAPKPGEKMPNFVLPDERGNLSVSTVAEKGPVAVTFHRGHWCPYCRINTSALAEAQAQIAAEGGQVAAIMPDREHFTAELKAESEAPFPILTDIDNGYALSLNLAFWVGDEMQELMTRAGWDVAPSQGQRHLAAADPRHLRRRHRRRGEGALRRSRLPQAHDDRGSARGAQEPRIRTASRRVARPIEGTQHLHHGRRDGVRCRPATP